MNLALFVGQIHLDSQRKIIEGVYERSKELGFNLFTFSVYNTDSYSDVGEYNYLCNINYSEFDGFIIYTETIYDEVFRSAFTKHLLKYNKPCVSIDYNADDVFSVMSDNYDIMFKLVEHLIVDHKVSTINYVSGPAQSIDSQKRLEAFYNAMKFYGLKVDENRIYHGNYYAESGIDAVKYFKNHDLLQADAYVCANDQTALGVNITLKENGIIVPRDTLLTGFDNIPQARFNIPSITSVSRNEKELGKLACSKVFDLILGSSVKSETVPANIVFRESCCGVRDLAVNDLFDYYSSIMLDSMSYTKLISESAISFTQANSLQDLCLEYSKYLEKLKINEAQIYLNYEDDSTLITIQNGHYCIEQTNVNLVSKKLREVDEEESFYLLCPLHYLAESYGYIMIKDSFLPLHTEAFHLFVLNMSNALKSLKTLTNIKNLAEQVKESSRLDSLTQVYNRLGFFDIADDIYSKIKFTGESLYIIFSDLDGLKKVNDTLGHKAGDSFIKCFANTLKAVFKDELIMRFGGDEFVVMGRNRTESEIEAQIEYLKTEIDKVNTKNTDFYPFYLSSSYGYKLIDATCNSSLSELIDEADKCMYEKKKSRRQAI